MKYVIDENAFEGIKSFYLNVAKKYKHSYSRELMNKNIDDAINSMYRIENGLLRRKPTIPRWEGCWMANDGKWYFSYTIEGDTIKVMDACHSQNMHESLVNSELKLIKEWMRRLGCRTN